MRAQRPLMSSDQTVGPTAQYVREIEVVVERERETHTGRGQTLHQAYSRGGLATSAEALLCALGIHCPRVEGETCARSRSFHDAQTSQAGHSAPGHGMTTQGHPPRPGYHKTLAACCDRTGSPPILVRHPDRDLLAVHNHRQHDTNTTRHCRSARSTSPHSHPCGLL